MHQAARVQGYAGVGQVHAVRYIFVYVDADSEGLKSFTTKVIEYFIADLKSQKQENSKKIAVSKSLAADNFGSKLLKNILFLNESYIDKYCDKLS